MKMVALVSDQRMQNIIPILQKDANYNDLWLVLSKDRNLKDEKGNPRPSPRFEKSVCDVQGALKALPGLQVHQHTEYVDPFNIENTRTSLISLLNTLKEHDDVVLNITGGTKPMSIAALQAAKEVKVQSVYTNTEDMELIWLSPDDLIRQEPIELKGVDVALYIRAYGEKVVSSQEASKLDEKQILWANTIVEHHELIYQHVIFSLMRHITANRIYPIVCPPFSSLTHRRRECIDLLISQGLWEWDEESKSITVPDQTRADFLCGDWVEIYTATQLQQSGVFDDVRLNVKLKGIDEDIDVAAVSNGKLALIECKSNLQFTVHLNKLDGFRRRPGQSHINP